MRGKDKDEWQERKGLGEMICKDKRKGKDEM